MSNPTVSVILPVYNGENYLRFAIESVLGQTLQDFELIVIDDGSSDPTPGVARSYGERVRYVRQNNTGVAGAFNHGLRLAAGRYISWLSHDDVFHPAKLENQVNALSHFSGPAVSYTDLQVIDARGEVVGEHRLPGHEQGQNLRHILTGGAVCSACYSVMYDRRCIEEVGPYSEALRSTQDVDMLARLARRFPLVHVPSLLMQVREHESRGVHSKEWERDVVQFFRRQLNKYPLAELFPELGAEATGRQKAQARVWLAETLEERGFPYYLAAYSQYRGALRESPASAPQLLPKLSRLFWRHFRQRVNRQSLKMKLAALKAREAN
ncbi:MAG TPA: glycosyltransferase [Pyrinomonadaceae bacterium]|nr:glycosyltransferase [Pyrinomonadaceae bacterium]